MTRERIEEIKKRVENALPTLCFDPGAVWYQIPEVFAYIEELEAENSKLKSGRYERGVTWNQLQEARARISQLEGAVKKMGEALTEVDSSRTKECVATGCTCPFDIAHFALSDPVVKGVVEG